MGTIIKLAYRNLIGAGLRTWLSVIVLSFTYILIIWHQGLFLGMLKQATYDTIQDDVAGGQYWINGYDPYDAVTWDDSYGKIPVELQPVIAEGNAVPVLFRPATIYPQGRTQPVLIRGIDPNQTVLRIPTKKLAEKTDILPVLIGARMAEKNKFKLGDMVTIRFRDRNGTFDAVDGKIVEIISTSVPGIDNGTLWVDINRLSNLMNVTNTASMVIIKPQFTQIITVTGWTFKSLTVLMKEINDIVDSKKKTSYFLYLILLFLALIAIFDTQILSIFRRKKEIGTLMALGFKRITIIGLFTIEGVLHGILAIGAAALYGVPLLWYFAKYGFDFPVDRSDFGYALATKIIPYYSAGLVMGTIILIMVTVTIVSYIPTRKISKLNPTEALRGKVS